MVQPCLRAHQDLQSTLSKTHAQIDIVKCDCQLFIHPSGLQIDGCPHHQARAGHGTDIVRMGIDQTRERTEIVPGALAGKCMSRDPAVSEDDACMLDGAVWIIQQRACSAYLFPAHQADQLTDRIRFQDLCVIVQKEQVFTVRVCGAEVVDGCVVERPVILQHPDPAVFLLNLLIESKSTGFLGVILQDQDLQILPGVHRLQRIHAFSQIFHMILIGNHDSDQFLFSIDCFHAWKHRLCLLGDLMVQNPGNMSHGACALPARLHRGKTADLPEK